MKVVAFLTVILDIATVHSLSNFLFKTHILSNETIWTGPVPRIYNGIEAHEHQFPFMIFALFKRPDLRISHCSASLLSPNWVLLAAHCLQIPGLKPENIILVGGKANLLNYVTERLQIGFEAPINEARHGLQERRAEDFFRHPSYDDIGLNHDVGLIKLKEPFNSTAIETIPISEDKMKESKLCTILGWGLTRGNFQTFKLNFVKNKQVSTTRLGCIYKPSGPFLCLRPDNRGICQGDSGSPLICEGKVWGVASHLVSSSLDPDCGDSLEEYYSEIHEDLKWIKSVYNKGYTTAAFSIKGSFACVLAILWLFVDL